MDNRDQRDMWLKRQRILSLLISMGSPVLFISLALAYLIWVDPLKDKLMLGHRCAMEGWVISLVIITLSLSLSIPGALVSIRRFRVILKHVEPDIQAIILAFLIWGSSLFGFLIAFVEISGLIVRVRYC